MRQFITAVVVVALLALPAAALARTRGGGFGYFGPMVAKTDVDGFNQVFKAQGFTELNSLHWLIGGGGYALVNHLIIGGSGAGGLQTIASDSIRCEVGLAGGQFELGYVPLVTKHLLVGPALGIGGWGYTLTLEPTRGDVKDLNELLLHPGRTSQVTFAGFSLAPELVVHVPISFAGLQLKAGYLYLPMTPEWQLADGNRLLNGPKLAKGMLFANLNIAFGGMGSGRRHHGED